MWSAGISVESYARLASRVYARGDRFLYGYYNSEQHLIQVKICTAVDKEKSDQASSERLKRISISSISVFIFVNSTGPFVITFESVGVSMI